MGGRSGQSIGGSAGSNIDNLAKTTAADAAKIHKGDIVGYERFVYKDIDGMNTSSRNLKSTEELKKEVGRFISTDKIYNKDNVSLPQDVKYHIQELGKTKVDNLINSRITERVKISDINIVQQYVFESPLRKEIGKRNPKILLFEHQGKFYLNDGNHRTAAAKLRGDKYINAVIEKV
mgnify:FL=1